MAFQTIYLLLENSGLPFRLHDHVPVRTFEDAQTRVPHLTRNLIKTIVFKIKDSHWILAGVNAQDRIDYKLLGRAFGVNRKQIRTVPPERVEADLGFEIGGTGPFPVNDDVRVVLDESLMELDTIFCGSGKNTLTVEMAVTDLACLVKPIISPIRKA
ncbi:YbaK/EbsC family protein [Desulfospira joergensenii]|uniref:YbaK/EbsC family protein n=1 Tax=Desulfospira joergensenii TaxID=53329 RepID=UPI0003B5070B|nr:YbaK/EbsC family protein [Desulfospira joergensenii]